MSKQVYHLKLSSSMKIYNVFYILLLKLYQNISKNAQTLLIEMKSENKPYKIEKILNNRTHYEKLQYLIK